MSDSLDWRILDRHLAGEASPDEEAALHAWLAGDASNADLLNAARAAAAADRRGEMQWDVGRAWSRVAARVQESPDATLVALRARPFARARRFHYGLRALGAAAIVAAAAGIVAVAWPRSPSPTIARSATHVREVVAGVAQQTRVTLDDGTRVILNAGSRLRYSADFGRTARAVQLEGEGYFDVVHDEARPFRVHARGSVTQDVGTRFVVRAYPEQPSVDIAVTHGVVAVRRERASTPPATLTAGQHGRVEPSGAIIVVDDPDVERWTEWTRGGIVLEGISLADAAVELGRRFGVPIHVPSDELARRRVSARFHDEPLPRVLDALGVALDVRWRRDRDRIVIERSE